MCHLWWLVKSAYNIFVRCQFIWALYVCKHLVIWTSQMNVHINIAEMCMCVGGALRSEDLHALSHNCFYYTWKPECTIPDDNMHSTQNWWSLMKLMTENIKCCWHCQCTLVLKCNKNNYDCYWHKYTCINSGWNLTKQHGKPQKGQLCRNRW